MEINYLIILDFTNGCLNIIKLTPEEKEEAYKYDSFEDFLYTIEDKYGFRVSNSSQWMTTERLEIYRYENGNLIEN